MASDGAGTEDYGRHRDDVPHCAHLQGHRSRSHDCSLHHQPLLVGQHRLAVDLFEVSWEQTKLLKKIRIFKKGFSGRQIYFLLF